MVVLCGLWAAGIALQPVDRRLEGTGSPHRGPGIALAGGMFAAVFGELRGLVADGLWLRTYEAWAREDGPATRRLIRLVTTVDERPLCFWVDGARMLAYDVPQWRTGGAGSRNSAKNSAADALHLLEDARRCHPDSALLCVETANVQLHVRGDLAAAATWYRKAAACPDAPPFAARIYAELLQRQGRYREAYAWLRALHPTLRPEVPDAMPEVVLLRIRRLEDLLAVPAENRYLSSHGNQIRRFPER